jgi:prophage regulatory protein
MDRLLDWRELSALVPYCRQHIGRLEDRGEFPKRRLLSPNRVAWLESEVSEWLNTRKLGGPPQKDLGPKPAESQAPDSADLALLRELAAKLGVMIAPMPRKRGRPPSSRSYRRLGAGP